MIFHILQIKLSQKDIFLIVDVTLCCATVLNIFGLVINSCCVRNEIFP